MFLKNLLFEKFFSSKFIEFLLIAVLVVRLVDCKIGFQFGEISHQIAILQRSGCSSCRISCCFLRDVAISKEVVVSVAGTVTSVLMVVGTEVTTGTSMVATGVTTGLSVVASGMITGPSVPEVVIESGGSSGGIATLPV